MTVNENNVINNVNETSTTVTLNKKVTLVAGVETLRLDVFDENGAKPASFSTNVITEELDDTDEAVIKNGAATTFNIDHGTGNNSDYNIPDGTLYFKLYKVVTSNGKTTETLLAEQQVTKNTVAPALAEVSAVRVDTDTATFAGTRYGESDIKTVYYCAVPSKDSSYRPYWDPIKKSFESDSYSTVTKQFDMTGKESINSVIDGLERDKAYRFYYVLENKWGSQSVPTRSWEDAPLLELSEDKVTNKVEAITDITLPESLTGNFSWVGNGKYIVTLYKNGNIVYEDKEFTGNNFSLTAYKANIEEGEYYIKVVKKGNPLNATPTLNSEATVSGTVTVKAVAPVSNIKYSVDETTQSPKLSWTENDTNCGGYQLKFYRETQDGTGVVKVNPITTETSNKASKSIILKYDVELNTIPQNAGWSNSGRLMGNFLYKLEVTAKAANNVMNDTEETEGVVFYVNSQPETYNFYSPYRTATLVSTTDSSVKIQLDTSTSTVKAAPYYGDKYAYGKTEADYTYSVRVYKNGTEYVGVKPVTVLHEDTNGDNKVDEKDAVRFKVEGLEANTAYSFRLVTTSGEFEGWSNEIAGIHTMPRIEGLTKVDTRGDCKKGSNKFFLYGDDSGAAHLVIDKNDYNLADYYGTSYISYINNLWQFLYSLKTGDTVTISDENISVTLANNEESSKSKVLNCAYVKDKVVTLIGNSHERKLVTTDGNEPAELHLKGTNAQFDISLVNVKEETGKIVLEGNTKIKTTAAKTLIVAGNVNAEINRVAMKPSIETKVNTTADTLTVYANNEGVNNLEFSNINNSMNGAQVDQPVNIKFVSENGNAITQQGSITIVGNGGTVTVTQENVTVNGGLTVNVEKGEVDVSDANIVGNKTVTLAKNATITALVAAKVPDVLVGKTLEVKNYANAKALREGMKDNVSEGYEITAEALESVNAWLSAFGINGKGATVKADFDGSVTITNNGTETLNIQGLK